MERPRLGPERFGLAWLGLAWLGLAWLGLYGSGGRIVFGFAGFVFDLGRRLWVFAGPVMRVLKSAGGHQSDTRTARGEPGCFDLVAGTGFEPVTF
ncbi:hypothetical protein, partial [Mesorhizobium sp. B2-4-8]|uniref:hypothetical protein n=1 Tax=Mesorhizobium sp. B2-4-8 TaxID=2589941 RepID=UPI0011757450